MTAASKPSKAERLDIVRDGRLATYYVEAREGEVVIRSFNRYGEDIQTLVFPRADCAALREALARVE